MASSAMLLDLTLSDLKGQNLDQIKNRAKVAQTLSVYEKLMS